MSTWDWLMHADAHGVDADFFRADPEPDLRVEERNNDTTSTGHPPLRAE